MKLYKYSGTIEEFAVERGRMLNSKTISQSRSLTISLSLIAANARPPHRNALCWHMKQGIT